VCADGTWTNCRKKGTALSTKTEVTTRRDAVHWIKVIVYDNGWLPGLSYVGQHATGRMSRSALVMQ
jgi:hypothetical protein